MTLGRMIYTGGGGEIKKFPPGRVFPHIDSGSDGSEERSGSHRTYPYSTGAGGHVRIMMWSSNWVRFMGVLAPLGVNWVREEGVVRVTRWRFPDGCVDTIVSIPLTTVESDPDEAREMVVTAMAVLNTFEP